MSSPASLQRLGPFIVIALMTVQTSALLGLLVQQQQRDREKAKPSIKIVHSMVDSWIERTEQGRIFSYDISLKTIIHNVGANPVYVSGAIFFFDCLQQKPCYFTYGEKQSEHVVDSGEFVLAPGEAKILNFQDRASREIATNISDEEFNKIREDNEIHDYGYISYRISGDNFSGYTMLSGIWVIGIPPTPKTPYDATGSYLNREGRFWQPEILALQETSQKMGPPQLADLESIKRSRADYLTYLRNPGRQRALESINDPFR